MNDLIPKRDKLLVGGYWSGVILRDGLVLDAWEDHNIVVNQGLDDMLSVYLTGGSQKTSWFLAPFSGNYVPVSTDTAASIPGNATEFTGYQTSTRVPYAGVEGSQAVTNANAPASLTFTAAATIYGAFMSSASAKSSTSGVLFAAVQFSSAKSLAVGDQLLLTYQVGAASS